MNLEKHFIKTRCAEWVKNNTNEEEEKSNERSILSARR